MTWQEVAMAVWVSGGCLFFGLLCFVWWHREEIG